MKTQDYRELSFLIEPLSLCKFNPNSVKIGTLDFELTIHFGNGSREELAEAKQHFLACLRNMLEEKEMTLKKLPETSDSEFTHFVYFENPEAEIKYLCDSILKSISGKFNPLPEYSEHGLIGFGLSSIHIRNVMFDVSSKEVADKVIAKLLNS